MAKPVKRARYVAPSESVRSRLGGLPSHLPSRWPHSAITGTPMAFVAQFYRDELAPLLPDDILCIQLYQPLENYDPNQAPGELSPLVVTIPRGAALNVSNSGIANPHIRQLDVEWEDDVESEWIDPERDDENLGLYLRTKFGGAAPDEAIFRSGRFVGVIADRGEGINLGMPSLVLVRRDSSFELVPDYEVDVG